MAYRPARHRLGAFRIQTTEHYEERLELGVFGDQFHGFVGGFELAFDKKQSPTLFEGQPLVSNRYQPRQDQAVDAAAKAISLDPSDPAAYEAMSNAMSFAARPGEALAFAEAADRVDPVSKSRKPGAARQDGSGVEHRRPAKHPGTRDAWHGCKPPACPRNLPLQEPRRQ